MFDWFRGSQEIYIFTGFSMQNFARSLIVLSLTVALGACSSIFGGGDDDRGSELVPRTTAIGVNGYLWQATLDTLSFMPFDQVEPTGGIIVSEWFAAPESPNERVKVTVRFLSEELRADGLKVTVLRQENQSNNWVTLPVQAATGLQIEEAILTAARRLRLDAN
jgi:hypothetical protein